MLAGLGEDPGDLLAVDEDVVRVLDRRARRRSRRPPPRAATSVSSGQRATGGGGRRTTESASPVPGSSTQTRPSRPRPAVWCSASATVPCGGVGRRHRLGRRRLDRVEVRCGRKRPRSRGRTISGTRATATRVGPPCNRASRRVVQSARDARPDVPLVYDRLSDPILVTRAKAGDADGPRGALRAARAARRAARAAPAARPRGRARRRAGVAREARRPDPPVPRRVAVLDLAPPARRQHLQGLRAGAGGPPHGAAARATSAPPATATRSPR